MPGFATIVANHALGISKHHRCRPFVALISILTDILPVNILTIIPLNTTRRTTTTTNKTTTTANKTTTTKTTLITTKLIFTL